MLTHCPICKYNLTGLPDRHVCPECGYQFDRDSDVLVMFKPTNRWLHVFYSFCFLFGVLFLFKNGSIFALLIPVAYAISAVVHHFWTPQRLAVVTPTEIQCIKGRSITNRVPLDSIVAADWSFVDGRIRLLDAGGSEFLDVPKGLIWTSAQTKKLAAIIDNRLKSKAAQTHPPA